MQGALASKTTEIPCAKTRPSGRSDSLASAARIEKRKWIEGPHIWVGDYGQKSQTNGVDPNTKSHSRGKT